MPAGVWRSSVDWGFAVSGSGPASEAESYCDRVVVVNNFFRLFRLCVSASPSDGDHDDGRRHGGGCGTRTRDPLRVRQVL